MNRMCLRPLWLAWALLLSLVIGICGAALTFAGGDGVPAAVMAGGAAFLGCATLLILVLTFVGPAEGR